MSEESATSTLRFEIETAAFSREAKRVRADFKAIGKTAKDVAEVSDRFEDLIVFIERSADGGEKAVKAWKKQIKELRDLSRSMRAYAKELQLTDQAERRLVKTREAARVSSRAAALTTAVKSGLGAGTQAGLQTGLQAALKEQQALENARKNAVRKEIQDLSTKRSLMAKITSEGERQRLTITKQFSDKIIAVGKKEAADLAKQQEKTLASTRRTIAANAPLTISHIKVVEGIRKRLLAGEQLHREERAIIAQVRRKVAHNVQLSESEKRLASAIKQTTLTMGTSSTAYLRLARSVGEVQKTLARARNLLLVYMFAARLVIDPMKRLVQAAAEFEKGFEALGIASRRMGIEVSSARTAVISLTRDGLLNAAQASLALSRLLATGIGLDKAIELLKSFKDSAVFAGQGTRTLNDNIIVAIDGFRNFQSRALDNIGITKNASVIIAEYAKSVDRSTSSMTELEKHLALANGLIKEARVFSGSAAIAASTLTGQVERLSNSWELLKAAMAPSDTARDLQWRGGMLIIRRGMCPAITASK